MPETAKVCYKLTLAYDGRNYFGWQRLSNKATIQGELEDAIASVVKAPIVVQGAGRTDRGAHAEGQVASFTLNNQWEEGPLMDALNETLPPTIRVLDCEEVPTTFHARMSAVGKEYAYLIWNRPELDESMDGRVWYVPERLSFGAMEEAVRHVVGRHDFASFGTKPKHGQTSTEREIYSAELDLEDDVMTFRFQGNSFLNHMVRNMVRTIVRVGEGKFPPNELIRILEAKNRQAAPGSAPASGLYLMEVFYGDETE